MFSKLFEELKKRNSCISIIGLGYVGLPLAVAFAKKFKIIGFDIKKERIEQLINNIDITKEISSSEIEDVKENIEFTSDAERIKDSRVIIVTVPTPIDSHKLPDLTLIKKASQIVGESIISDSIVVYESTVYPGVVEEICVPIIENISGLKWKKDFYAGYSPERINPGDKEHTLPKIKKIVAGDTDDTTDFLEQLYSEIIEAGVYKVSSIKVAEAAKVIENTQRDLNIALMNELAMIFHRLNIDTKEVLDAASTKWNFLKFTPGLVGGHCIGVDPYYLTFKAEEIGYHPQIILAGRRINDYMGKYIAEETVKLLIRGGHQVKGAKVGVLGITFKENVSDIRNTKVIDIIQELKEYGIDVIVYDPIANKDDVKKEYKIDIADKEELRNLNGIILAVAHNEFKNITKNELNQYFSNSGKKIFVDVKSIYNRRMFDNTYIYWRL